MGRSKKTKQTRPKPKLGPLGEKVLVRRSEAEDKSQGGIVLPDAAREKPQKGTVLAVGPGKLLDSGNRAKPGVDVGDTVVFPAYAGTDVKVEGVEYLLIDESDILAIVG